MKNIAKTLFTLLIGMALGTASLAAAAPGTVEAALTKFKIVVNGQEAQLSNTPLVYKGTTYLPVREVANLLDANLNYDGANKKIELNTKGADLVQVTKTVSFRELVELLSKKYPDKKVSLTADGLLYFGDDQFQLSFEKDPESIPQVDISEVIDLGILSNEDFQ